MWKLLQETEPTSLLIAGDGEAQKQRFRSELTRLQSACTLAELEEAASAVDAARVAASLTEVDRQQARAQEYALLSPSALQHSIEELTRALSRSREELAALCHPQTGELQELCTALADIQVCPC